MCIFKICAFDLHAFKHNGQFEYIPSVKQHIFLNWPMNKCFSGKVSVELRITWQNRWENCAHLCAKPPAEQGGRFLFVVRTMRVSEFLHSWVKIYRFSSKNSVSPGVTVGKGFVIKGASFLCAFPGKINVAGQSLKRQRSARQFPSTRACFFSLLCGQELLSAFFSFFTLNWLVVFRSCETRLNIVNFPLDWRDAHLVQRFEMLGWIRAFPRSDHPQT